MYKTMEFLLFWGLISGTSAQLIIYGSNVPQRNPAQPFIIFGNNPQQSSSGGNPPPQPFISGGNPPPQPFISGGNPPPQPFISGGIIPQQSPPPQPILGGNPLQQIFDGGNFSPNPSQQITTSVNLPPQQATFGGSPPQASQTTLSVVPARATGGSSADGAFGDSEYHYSWLHDGDQKYNHDGAIRYCNGLGGGWRAVSIESLDESFFINVVINSHKKSYSWTAGVKDGSGWRWLNGGPLTYTNWSFTGGRGQPQPDDREGNENCLAILNNVYRDGLKWHDIACHHAKPVICERTAQKSVF